MDEHVLMDVDIDLGNIKRVLVREIIDTLRQSMLAMNQDDPHSLPWDEQEEGAASLDNEIYAFRRLPMAPESIRQTFDSIRTVEGFRRALIRESLPFLTDLYSFISAGGTGSEEWETFLQSE